MTSGIHISLRAENLFTIGGIFPVTNSLLTTWIVMLLLVILAFRIKSNISKIPGYMQSVFEMLIGTLYDMFGEILRDKNDKYFPFLMTIFLMVISLNWSGLLPGVGTIGFYEKKEEVKQNIVYAKESNRQILTENKKTEEEIIGEDLKKEQDAGEKHESSVFVPVFRSGTADLNMTIALAIMAVGSIQIAGFTNLGVSYLKKFFNFSNPIYTFVGLLELISEFSKIISFSFRLFGNIFAGEVLLTVIAFLIPILAPLPFLGLEVFVGFIQALVFSMLTAIFLSTAMAHEEH